ncbi:MAG: MFS transporter, partial [Bacteroidales bacterium]|nr:MFS transporter [Bacteroidales bacterium]
HIIYYICFIILYRLAEGFIMKIAPLFLRSSRDIGGLGLSLTQIGTLNGICGSAAFVLGSLLAGFYVSKFGLKKTLFSLCCVFNFPFVVYTLLALFRPESLYLVGAGIVFEYFGYGFGFVGLTLFMMQQIAPGEHQMSHYAFASGIMNLGVMLPGMMSGFFSDLLGYKIFFCVVLVATIPSFLMTYFIPFTYDENGNRLETATNK